MGLAGFTLLTNSPFLVFFFFLCNSSYHVTTANRRGQLRRPAPVFSRRFTWTHRGSIDAKSWTRTQIFEARGTHKVAPSRCRCVLNKELEAHCDELVNRPTLLVCNKLDRLGGVDEYNRLRDCMNNFRGVCHIHRLYMLRRSFPGVCKLRDCFKLLSASQP